MAAAQFSPVRDGPTAAASSSDPVVANVLRRARKALRLLCEARQYAAGLQRDPWDFAVEIEGLQQSGCTNNEFRWLVCKGYVDHAVERTLPGDSGRTFQRLPRGCKLTFRRSTCFVLTESGFDFARSVVDDGQASPTVLDATDAPGDPSAAVVELKPVWDRARQELRLGDVVVKQFKVPAANQERILSAFQEEGWPVRIDDPLPPNSDQDPKRRLHDTINSLNRNQKRNLLRFTGDGSGQGVLWQLTGDAD